MKQNAQIFLLLILDLESKNIHPKLARTYRMVENVHMGYPLMDQSSIEWDLTIITCDNDWSDNDMKEENQNFCNLYLSMLKERIVVSSGTNIPAHIE